MSHFVPEVYIIRIISGLLPRLFQHFGEFLRKLPAAQVLRYDDAVGRDQEVRGDRRDPVGCGRRALLVRVDAQDIPCAPVNSLDDVLADPHFQARGMVSEGDGQPRLRFPVPLRDLPADRAQAPAIGEHTQAILAELGLPPDALVNATRAVN